MSGYPFDPATSFVRHPGGYAHDAFGHVGADDAGIRSACFRKIPHTGIDLSSKHPSTNRPLQRTTPVLSPVYGTIVATGSDPEAGLWQIVHAYGRDEWWIGGHHSALVKRSGNVARGELIARMGDTGGAQGVHTHWSVATSLAAALAYIGGWVQYRNGRTVAAWAGQAIRGQDRRTYGLVDPWPLIEREWAAHEAHLDNLARAAEAARIEQERAATAAAEKAAAEAAAKEDDMKTRLVRVGGDILVVNVGERFVWHVPNTRALPAAYVMADDPEVHELDADAFAALLSAMDEGRDATRIAALGKRLTAAA